jgi:hypothetical protein
MPLDTLRRLSESPERFGDLLTEAAPRDPLEVPPETWRCLSRLAAEVALLADEMGGV